LEVYRPPEHLCTPRPRQAATTLAASTTEVRTSEKEQIKFEREVDFVKKKV
jgi:hypothetical protein